MKKKAISIIMAIVLFTILFGASNHSHSSSMSEFVSTGFKVYETLKCYKCHSTSPDGHNTLYKISHKYNDLMDIDKFLVGHINDKVFSNLDDHNQFFTKDEYRNVVVSLVCYLWTLQFNEE